MFQAEDPGGAVVQRLEVTTENTGKGEDSLAKKPEDASIRIDLKRIEDRMRP